MKNKLKGVLNCIHHMALSNT